MKYRNFLNDCSFSIISGFCSRNSPSHSITYVKATLIKFTVQFCLLRIFVDRIFCFIDWKQCDSCNRSFEVSIVYMSVITNFLNLNQRIWPAHFSRLITFVQCTTVIWNCKNEAYSLGWITCRRCFDTRSICPTRRTWW